MREKIRLFILDKYGIDIDSIDMKHRAGLVAYLINVGEFTIRISSHDSESYSREEQTARMMWADDLRLFKGTVCEPIPSKTGSLVETMHVGKWLLTFNAYRTAKGSLIEVRELKPIHFVVLGDLIGGIHSASMDQMDIGMRYKIPALRDRLISVKETIALTVSLELRKKMERLINEISKISKRGSDYGVCYAEFDLSNIIMDNNNPYIFDFDNCIYAHYVYDVATLALSVVSLGYMSDKGSREVIYKNFMPWFTVGYRMNKQIDESSFEKLELFMKVRILMVIMELVARNQGDDNQGRLKEIQVLAQILDYDDVFEGLDKVRNLRN